MTGTTGVLTLQNATPENCQGEISGAACSEEYDFSVSDGFIQLVSTDIANLCVAGSAQESTAYLNRGDSLLSSTVFLLTIRPV